jgi:DNA-binding LytR/AlgR family response regulator
VNRIKCVIVDDDELARDLLKTYVDKIAFLELQGSFEDPLNAVSFLQSKPIDIVFLDIQMPEINGTDFAELIKGPKPKVIFTTAYSEYALEGFELNALDYLLKPITFKRFLSAVEKYPKTEASEKEQVDHIVIKSGYDYHRVLLNEVLYIESFGEYVHYHLENGNKITANQSMTKLLGELPNTFLRVHRSYIVNGQKVSGLKGRELLIKNQNIPISETYYEEVKTSLFS